MRDKFNKCTHCGSNIGYYNKYVSSDNNEVKYYFDINGNPGDNPSFPDKIISGGYLAYCTSCNEVLFRMNIFDEGY